MIIDIKERTEKKLFIEFPFHDVCMRPDLTADNI